MKLWHLAIFQLVGVVLSLGALVVCVWIAAKIIKAVFTL